MFFREEKPVQSRQNRDGDKEANIKPRNERSQQKKEIPAKEDDQQTSKKRTRQTVTQFTITLNGASMSSYFAKLILKATPKPKKDEPQMKRQKIVTPEKASINTEASSTKLKASAAPFVPASKQAQKCSFFPACTRPDCPFFHPTEPCKCVCFLIPN